MKKYIILLIILCINFASAKEVILDVPMIYQRDSYSCATTSLAMLISYYDDTVYSKNDFWKASKTGIRTIMLEGNSMMGLELAAGTYNYDSTEFLENLTIKDLEQYINNSMPVVANIFNPIKKNQHAVLVIGYNDENNKLIINDPSKGRIIVSYEEFKDIRKAKLANPNKVAEQSAFIVYKQLNVDQLDIKYKQVLKKLIQKTQEYYAKDKTKESLLNKIENIEKQYYNNTELSSLLWYWKNYIYMTK